MADAKAANEHAFTTLCSKTSSTYPFTIKNRPPAPPVNTTKVSVLWPVLLSTLLALPSLVYAIIIAPWRYATHSAKAETCEFAHADTPRNRLLVSRLRKSLAAQPPPTNWCAHSGDLGTLVPFATFGEGAPVNWRRRWLRVARAPAPDGIDGHKRRGGKDDDEAVALDVSLPDQPRDDAPVILVLHGPFSANQRTRADCGESSHTGDKVWARPPGGRSVGRSCRARWPRGRRRRRS